MFSMRLISIFTALFAFFTLTLALPVAVEDLDRRDVWAPAILYPHAGTVWKVGNHHNVTWDLSSKPAQITNPIGTIFLRVNGLTDDAHPLASGFNLTNGRQEIQVPNVAPGSAYELVLMGDSGNFSPDFTIEA